MANDVNTVVIVGNLVRDCGSNERDFGYTQGGMCMANISLASNRSKKNQDGSWGSEVSYFDIKIFGKTAENLKPYLLKGQKLAVSGSLRQERWQDKQGKNQSRVVIIADNVQLVGGKKDDAGFNPNTIYSTAQAAQQASSYAQQYQNQQNNQQGGRPQFTPQNQPAPHNFNGQPFPEDVPGNDYPEEIPF